MKRPSVNTALSSTGSAPAIPSSPPKKKRLALIRSFSLPDFITLGNAAAGTSSIFLCLNYLGNDRHEPYLVAAFCLLPFALICDIADGYVARLLKKHSPFGADLDSLADVVSFNVAPAVLAFTLGMRGLYDCILLSFFVCAGISRLARYNVTSSSMSDASGKVKFYQGFPVPTSLLLVIMLAIAYSKGAVFDRLWGGFYVLPWGGTFHPLSLSYLVVGCLMMSSNLRIPKP